MADTVVFIPAWNEEENLPAVLEELWQELPEADVLVVDDGSSDATAEVARAAGAEVLSFGENRGLRTGIAAGWRWAAEHGTRTQAGWTPTASIPRPSYGVCSSASVRASGESKLRGSKALKLVLTVGATLVLGRRVLRFVREATGPRS